MSAMDNTTERSIDAATLRAWLADDQTVHLVDVRTPGEFETAHIPGSYNVPLDTLEEHGANLRQVNQPVVLEVTSADVIHSFWVPDLGGKLDANPGLVNRMSFTAERAGQFRAVCAELCGWGHYRMIGRLYVHESYADFQEWLRVRYQEQHRKGTPTASIPAK